MFATVVQHCDRHGRTQPGRSTPCRERHQRRWRTPQRKLSAGPRRRRRAWLEHSSLDSCHRWWRHPRRPGEAEVASGADTSAPRRLLRQVVAGLFDRAADRVGLDRGRARDGDSPAGHVDVDVSYAGQCADFFTHRRRAVPTRHSGDDHCRCAHEMCPFGTAVVPTTLRGSVAVASRHTTVIPYPPRVINGLWWAELRWGRRH